MEPRSYLQPGYLPVNNCDVFTLTNMIVNCNVTNVSGKEGSANGEIFLSISGGTPPYTITWTYPNGLQIQGSRIISNLSVGTYVATVTDYYGDFVVTTSCTVGLPQPTTTTTSTTLPPIPNYLEYLFCLNFEFVIGKGLLNVVNLNFQFGDDINGFPSWITNSGNEIVYFNVMENLWLLSASTSSILNGPNCFNSTQPSWQVFNGSTYPPIPWNPNYSQWGYIQSNPNLTELSATAGVCNPFLYLTVNEWWALNESEIPSTYRYLGFTCNGSNLTPYFKWYLLGGLTSANILDFSITCIDLDTSYVHWSVDGIDSTQFEVSSTIPWIGTPLINPTSGDPGASNVEGWEGPCPPLNNTHTYQVTLTANLIPSGTLTSSVTFISSTP